MNISWLFFILQLVHTVYLYRNAGQKKCFILIFITEINRDNIYAKGNNVKKKKKKELYVSIGRTPQDFASGLFRIMCYFFKVNIFIIPVLIPAEDFAC